MTPFGILMPAMRPADKIPDGDERTMQIRSRRAKDLDILRAKYMPGTLGRTIHTPSFDYEYRAYCRPVDYAEAMYLMVLDVDYKKFKPETDKYADSELHTCYNAIWGVVMDKLSTPKHRYEYWHPVSTPGKGAKGSSSVKSVLTQAEWESYRPSSAGAFVGGTGLGYPDDTSQYTLPPIYNPGTRNTSADRDEYLPDVMDDWENLSAGSAALDALYKELGEVEKAIKHAEPTDHSKCEHAETRTAKARCRARRRRNEQLRVEEIRKMIDECYLEEDSSYGSDLPVLGSLEPVTSPPKAIEAGPSAVSGGYPWEKSKAEAAAN